MFTSRVAAVADHPQGTIRLHSRRYFFTIRYEMVRQFLTDFELMILLAILRLDEPAYCVPIAREIEETAGRSVVLAAVYAALDRLEERGLVTSSLGAPTPERGGRAKRIFTVTGRGLRSVRETRQALVSLWTGVPQLKGGEA
jgi:PadR family transcriptional regulator, regulatory protein PadR